MSWVRRLPAWAKVLTAAGGFYAAGVATARAIDTPRELRDAVRHTNARVDTLRSEVLLVRQEQGIQRAAIFEAQRRLRYLTCTTRPGANDSECVARHLLSSDVQESRR